jgi:hypothetical protein
MAGFPTLTGKITGFASERYLKMASARVAKPAISAVEVQNQLSRYLKPEYLINFYKLDIKIFVGQQIIFL